MEGGNIKSVPKWISFSSLLRLWETGLALNLALALLFVATIVRRSSACETRRYEEKEWDDDEYFNQDAYEPGRSDVITIFGGGVNESFPENVVWSVSSKGTVCQLQGGLPEPLYGAGAVRVRTGFVVCGGIGKGGKPSNKCWHWDFKKRKFDPATAMPEVGTGSTSGIVRMANDRYTKEGRDMVFAFVEGREPVFLQGKLDKGKLTWEKVIKGNDLTGMVKVRNQTCMTGVGGLILLIGGLRPEGEGEGEEGKAPEENGYSYEIKTGNWRSFPLPEDIGKYGIACNTQPVLESRKPRKTVYALWLAGGWTSASEDGKSTQQTATSKVRLGFLRKEGGTFSENAFELKEPRASAVLAPLRTTKFKRVPVVLGCTLSGCTQESNSIDRMEMEKDEIKWTRVELKSAQGNKLNSHAMVEYGHTIAPAGFFPECYGYEGDEGEGGKGSGGGRREAGIVVAAFVCSLLLLYEEM